MELNEAAPAQYSPVPDILVYRVAEKNWKIRENERKKEEKERIKKEKKNEQKVELLMKQKNMTREEAEEKVKSYTADEEDDGFKKGIGSVRERDWLDQSLLMYLQASPVVNQTPSQVLAFLSSLDTIPLSMEQKTNLTSFVPKTEVEVGLFLEDEELINKYSKTILDLVRKYLIPTQAKN